MPEWQDIQCKAVGKLVDEDQEDVEVVKRVLIMLSSFKQISFVRHVKNLAAPVCKVKSSHLYWATKLIYSLKLLEM